MRSRYIQEKPTLIRVGFSCVEMLFFPFLHMFETSLCQFDYKNSTF